MKNKVKKLNIKEIYVCSGGQSSCLSNGDAFFWPEGISSSKRCREIVCDDLKGYYWQFTHKINGVGHMIYTYQQNSGICSDYVDFTNEIAKNLLGEKFVTKYPDNDFVRYEYRDFRVK